MGMMSKEYHEGYQQGFKDVKADYENRLKADLKAILIELQLKIEELDTPNNGSAYMDCVEIIQQKINSLKEVKDVSS